MLDNEITVLRTRLGRKFLCFYFTRTKELYTYIKIIFLNNPYRAIEKNNSEKTADIYADICLNKGNWKKIYIAFVEVIQIYNRIIMKQKCIYEYSALFYFYVLEV